MKIPGIQHLTSNSSNELSVMSPREAESPEERCLRDKNFTCIAAYGYRFKKSPSWEFFKMLLYYQENDNSLKTNICQKNDVSSCSFHPAFLNI